MDGQQQRLLKLWRIERHVFAPGYSQGQYKIVSSAQSSAAVAFTPNTDNFIYIVDAIQAASAATGSNGGLMMMGFGS